MSPCKDSIHNRSAIDRRVHQTASQLHLSSTQPLPILAPKFHILTLSQPIHLLPTHPLRIHTFTPQHSLLLLIVPRSLMLRHHPQKTRHRILRQTPHRMLAQTLQHLVAHDVAFEQHGCAPGPAVMMRHLDAVDVGLVDLRMRAQDLGHFGRGHVFGFPAEGIADAVGEPPSSFLIPAHDVAGAHVRVACDEDVADDFAFGGGGVVEVALELGEDVGRVDFEEEFARFAARDGLAEVVGAGAEGEFGRPVYGYDGVLCAEDEGGEGTVAADGAGGEGVGGEVPGCADAFGGAVEFADGFDAEACLEWLPDVGSESVSESFGDAVCAIEVFACDGVDLGRGGEEVATCLADILDDCSFRLADLGPESFGREAVAEYEGT